MIQAGGEFEVRAFGIEYLVSFTLYKHENEIEINCVTVDGEEIDYFSLPELTMQLIMDKVWDYYYEGSDDVY